MTAPVTATAWLGLVALPPGRTHQRTFKNSVPPAPISLQAGIRHFLDAATAGAPPRMAARDCLRAAAVMAAARESLRSGAPVPVSYDFAAAAAGTGAVAAAAAAGKVSSKLGNAAASMVDSAQQAVAGAGQGKGAESPAGKPHEEGVSTPPHQRTPPAKAGPSTPESPGLLTNLPPEDDYSS